MSFRDTIKDYRRIAALRLQDARELMEPPTHEPERSDAARRHLRGAMYFAGYAVECLLKAYLIQQSGEQTLRQAVETLNEKRQRQGREIIGDISRSAKGHQVVYILRVTDLTGYPDYNEALWGRLAQWSSSWRYEPSAATRVEADEFIEDVQATVNWLAARFT